MALEWGTVADWVSGLGSLAAALTALYLATESRRVHLAGYCGLREVVGDDGERREFLFISVTNLGARRVVINHLGLRAGLFRERHAMLSAVQQPQSDGIPVTVEEGQVAQWGIPMGPGRAWLYELADSFLRSPRDVRTLRFLVYASDGTVKALRAEPALVGALLAVVEGDSR